MTRLWKESLAALAGGLLGGVAAMMALRAFRPDMWQIPAIRVVLVGGYAMLVCVGVAAPVMRPHIAAAATNAIRPWLGKLVYSVLLLQWVLLFGMVCAHFDFAWWFALIFVFGNSFAAVLLVFGCKGAMRDDRRP